jgi:hypothetical protein
MPISQTLDWIHVDVRLPAIDEWVLVFEDDTESIHDVVMNDLFKKEHWRVRPARIAWIDRDGYPRWHLCYVGGGPAGEYRNVTHWMPMPVGPLYRDVYDQRELLDEDRYDFARRNL